MDTEITQHNQLFTQKIFSYDFKIGWSFKIRLFATKEKQLAACRQPKIFSGGTCLISRLGVFEIREQAL